ncbi:MAG: UDP-N-acetylglucosamine--N-acetylmuramyl-(pentapeptide) pyrophosphoryl-undecaprenol N-acetylglucosamine transferase [Anaplasma sp.]
MSNFDLYAAASVMRHMRSIVLVAGGTGGHITPAIALYGELVERGYQCTLFTDERFSPYEERFPGINKCALPIRGRSGGVIGLLRFGAMLLRSCIVSYIKLRAMRPDLVIGFGAYPSFSILLAARLLSIDVVLHEQNSVMGLVNRVFAGYARVIAVGLPMCSNENFRFMHKIVHIGTPTSINPTSIKKGGESTKGDKTNLVLLGGSRGLCTFGEVVALAIAELPGALRRRISVTQQCSKGQLKAIERIYTDSGIEHRLALFFPDACDIINDANLIISRAGAATIAEVMAAGKPAVYIPYSRSAHNHQLHNARFIEDLGAGLCIEEGDLDVSVAKDAIMGLLENRERLRKMSESAMQHAISDAGARFCAVIDGLFARVNAMSSNGAP